ncbi:Rpn family recombination-promoting nuclease/putative transposase [Megamonas hypermegale]|uniref:Rpn family recombination-promoting nuclease/putative transposase n=1 Tax=Megamonas hypermegale TaxID=158847 RepID=UPI0026F21D3F|nr:Rpn family recombination-promoting nuclease/putative transposase [Megamonas hypermegale]
MEKVKINMINDVFFKSLLCDDRHKELTLNFLNSILDRTGDRAFCDIEFLDKEIDPIIEVGKVSVLDIRAKMNDDTQINVEVQIAKPKDMKKRALYYWSKLYSYQIKEGEDYSILRDVISINLLNFKLFTEHNRCHSSCHITDDFDRKTVIRDFEMHFIELPKFKLGDIKKLRKSEKWIALFSNKCTEEELEEIAMGEPAIKKALEYQNYFMHDEKLRHKYELQEKAIRDYNSSMLAAKEEGISIGKQQGIDIGKQQEKYDMAKQMLVDGVDIKFIAKYTKLSIDDIENLK